MTQEERAYRRGCLQAVQFLKAALSDETACLRSGEISEMALAGADACFSLVMQTMSVWEQNLIAGRCDDGLLGKYLDEIKKRINNG
jgi:hypothetical protein